MINLPTDFVPGHRYLTVYGTRSADAEFEIYANDQLIDHELAGIQQPNVYHPDIGVVQYSFSTRTSFFGVTPICIKMLTGSLTITRSRALYPAKITNSEGNTLFGYFARFQPIDDSKFLVRINGVLQTLQEQDQHLIGEVHYTINAGDTLQYFHATIEGPDYWWVILKSAQLKYIVDQEDPDLDFVGVDSYDRLHNLKNQLMADYTGSHS